MPEGNLGPVHLHAAHLLAHHRASKSGATGLQILSYIKLRINSKMSSSVRTERLLFLKLYERLSVNIGGQIGFGLGNN